MKKWFLVLILFLLSVATAFAGNLSLVVPNGTRTNSADYAIPTLEGATFGFLNVATPTLSVPASVAVQCPTLPAGTKFVRFWINPGAGINIGGSAVASGTTYPTVASNTASEWFPVATTTPTIYLIGASAAATATAQAK